MFEKLLAPGKIVLNIPEEYVVIAVAPVGYPAKEGKRTSKKTSGEV